MKILWVEDQLHMFYMYSKMLKYKGAEVVEVDYASTAIHILEGVEKPFDIIILDILLPAEDGNILDVKEPGYKVSLKLAEYIHDKYEYDYSKIVALSIAYEEHILKEFEKLNIMVFEKHDYDAIKFQEEIFKYYKKLKS